jgi:YjbE family integral membrane protein
VIALACRQLPAHQRTKGIMWGTAGAIILRVILIFFALTLLAIPYLKFVGAVLLIWIGVKLLTPDADDDHSNIQGSDKLWGAVKTVIIADLVMSVDNVIAIAGAAQASGNPDHQMPLVIFGLLVSIPIIVWGSQLVLKLMDRFPMIITAGGKTRCGVMPWAWPVLCWCWFWAKSSWHAVRLRKKQLKSAPPLEPQVVSRLGAVVRLWVLCSPQRQNTLEFDGGMIYHPYSLTREQMPCKKGSKA